MSEARKIIEQIERRTVEVQRLRVITLPGGIERSAARLDIDIDEALILKALWQYLARVSAMRRIALEREELLARGLDNLQDEVLLLSGKKSHLKRGLR